MADELNTRITMGVGAVNVMTVPIDDSLSIEGEAADAKAVGDALALKADRSEVQTAIRVNGQSADAQGLIIVTGEDIDVTSGGTETLSDAVTRIDGKTAADIPLSAQDATTIAQALAQQTDRTGEDIPVSASDSTPISTALAGMVPKTDIDTDLDTAGKVADAKAAGDAIQAVRTDLETQIGAAVKSVNEILPDNNGNVTITEVQNAQQLLTDDNQEVAASFTVRTTGGGGSVNDGTAMLTSLQGRMTHTGVVLEVLEMSVEPMPRGEGEENIDASLDAATFRAYVQDSATIDLYYTTEWSASPALYGVTVTGTPISGDHIRIDYTKGDRGTITPSNPTRMVATGWNLYNTQTGQARVTRYSDQYGYRIGGNWTALRWAETPGGVSQSIQPTGGLFNVPGDGWLTVTGGDSTTYVYTTWSDWISGYQGAFEPYRESVIDLSTAMAHLPWGLCQVGSVADEINLDSQQAISRIERMAYSDEAIAALEAAGRAYDADTNYIYAVRTSPESNSIAVSASYDCTEHGLEMIEDGSVAPFAVCLYGQNLKDKLRRDVLTISAQTLTTAQQAQARSNIGATTGADLAIVANGNTHAAIASGQFVYVRNHSTLAEGLYKATAAIGTNAALSTSNLAADTSGGLNDLQGQVATLNSKFTRKEYQFSDLAFSAGTIGTRGLQTSIDITSDMNAYGTLISLLITLISDSNKCHFQAFRYGSAIYLNGYRASDSAMANNSVFILATYMKN